MFLRISKIIIISLLFIAFCGCSYCVEPENRIILTAIGLDEKNGNLVLSAESADIISNTNEDLYNSHFVSVSGKDLAEALKNLENSSYGKIMFSQCPIVLIGDSLSEDNFEDFLKFCVSEHEIALSVRFLRCDNAEKILNSDKNGDTLIGYELLKLIEFGNSNQKRFTGDSFTEIYDKYSKNKDIYIPYVYLKHSGLVIENA